MRRLKCNAGRAFLRTLCVRVNERMQRSPRATSRPSHRSCFVLVLRPRVPPSLSPGLARALTRRRRSHKTSLSCVISAYARLLVQLRVIHSIAPLLAPPPTPPALFRHDRLSEKERETDIPIVALNPGGILNWKYKAETCLRSSPLEYCIVRATGLIPKGKGEREGPLPQLGMPAPLALCSNWAMPITKSQLLLFFQSFRLWYPCVVGLV